jgi:hypothetical protein
MSSVGDELHPGYVSEVFVVALDTLRTPVLVVAVMSI